MSRQLFIQHIKTQRKTDPFRFYVYAYLRSKDSIRGKAGTPYYIGKGQGRRAWGNHKHQKIPSNLDHIILLETHLTEVGALALERRYIKWYGRQDNNTGILSNLTDGGDNTYGAVLTEEHKRKISAAGIGRKHSQETKSKMSSSQIGDKNHQFGKCASEETKTKMKESQLGDKNHFYGKTHSEETILKLSIASSGKSPSAETRRKLSESTKGVKHKITICPHCNKEGGTTSMKRYHFDNCKSIQLLYDTNYLGN